MIWNNLPVFPVMGEPLHAKNALPLDFTTANTPLLSVDLSDTAAFDAFIFEQLRATGKKYGYGGYLEKRDIYRRSEVFATDTNFRNIHLGIDIWTEAGSPIFAPLDGVVHSFQDNVGFGNYGPTLILSHGLEGEKLFTLYGHLSRKNLSQFEVGRSIQAGEPLCEVGSYPENGDWPPHLHFQLVRDMGEHWGDYPGVAAEKDLVGYRKNCPDPCLFFGLTTS